MIDIFFYGGTHGNFLEFVLNKSLHGDKIDIKSPVSTSKGTSHTIRNNQNYLQHRLFEAKNSTLDNATHSNKSIIIDFDPEDDLTAILLNFKRGEDLNIDPDTLHIDTYHKLHNKPGVQGMIRVINQYSDITPYYNIKDPSWPDIESVDDFFALPDYIKQECREEFGFTPFYLSENNPHAPKWVLRDVIKHRFDSHNRPSAIISATSRQKQSYKFPFRCFYDQFDFVQQVHKVFDHFNLVMCYDNLMELHADFVAKVPYIERRYVVEQILDAVRMGRNVDIQCNVIEESYILAYLELLHGKHFVYEQDTFFPNTMDLKKFIDSFS